MTGDEVALTYTPPAPPERLSIEQGGVLSTVRYGGPWLTVPELLFEKKLLIPALQRVIIQEQLTES